MAEDQTPFKATQTFTHKYANEMVLRTYLMGTAGLKETQFRINIQDNKIEIQLTGESAKLEEEQLKVIYKLFQEAEDQKKQQSALEDQDGQD